MNFDYVQYITKQIVFSDFTKRKLNTFVISFFVSIIRLHITFFLCFCLSWNFYIDFFTQIFISVFFMVKSNWIFNLLNCYDDKFLKITNYLMDKYTPQNFKKWKRIVIIGTALYFFLWLLILPINNFLLATYILQYLITYFIVEQIEKKRFRKYIEDFKNRPHKIIYGNLKIKNNYKEIEEEELKNIDFGFIVVDNYNLLEENKNEKDYDFKKID